MARTLLGTGLAAKLRFLCGSDEDNANKMKIYISYDSSNVANTSAVQSDVTYDGTNPQGTTSWNGHTLPYIYGGNATKVNFGTNKPYISDSANRVGMFWIGESNHDTTSPREFSTTVTRAPVFCQTGSPTKYAFKIDSSGGDQLGIATNAMNIDEAVTIALFHDRTNPNSNCVYFGVAGGALAADSTTNNGNSATIGGSMATIFSGANAGWRSDAKFILLGLYWDDYADNATRLTALQGLHADPFGALFTSTGGLLKPKGMSGGMSVLNGGIDG